MGGDVSKPASSGGTAIKLDAVRDFRFQGYIGSSLVGVDIGSNAKEVEISNTEFVSTSKQAIIVRSGSKGGVNISNNTFEDVGSLKNNTYDVILAEAGASNFRIDGNTFKSSLANKPRYLINIASGASNNYVVAFNNFANYAAGDIQDSAGGAGRYIFGNVPTPSMGNIIGAAQPGTNFNGGVGFNNGVVFRSGIAAGTGLQHVRSSTGAIGPKASVPVTVKWQVAFPDSSYTVTCSVAGGAGQANANGLRIHHIESVSPASVVVRVVNDHPEFPKLGSLYCIGIHDQ